MNSNMLNHYRDMVASLNQDISEQMNDNEAPIHQTQQQKRQNSYSNFINNSNKRMPLNSLASPFGQSIYETGYGQVGSGGMSPQPITSKYSNNPVVRNSIKRSLLQSQGIQKTPQQTSVHNMKTPTPSAYDLPLSPSVNHISNVSVNNHSDLSDSNLMENQHLQQPSSDTFQNQDFSLTDNASSPTYQGNNRSLPLIANTNQAQQNQDTLQRQHIMTSEEQQLATKLKETYKNIVNYEDIVQKNCVGLTMKISNLSSAGVSNNNVPFTFNGLPVSNQHVSPTVIASNNMSTLSSKTAELLNDLWAVYHNNIALLDNYYDFLLTALKPTSSYNQFKTGKNIIDLYKIPRRMWVYGIVGFLEVLKNVIHIFHEHEICLCFIAYCFNVLSNLTDPSLDMEGWWSEKLGDLSRMAIALYQSRFIEWKISAEYWYSIALRTMYGHGKIYYHMCTVQQDNLEALVNIGKSVVCRDPFVPTHHYLRLVVENICTQRNILSLLELPIIDFIKIHKVLLSIHNTSENNRNCSPSDRIDDSQINYGIDLVSRYGLTFGSDSNGYNFFTGDLYTQNGVASVNDPHQLYYLQHHLSTSDNLELMNFWFNKGALFALANINHLIGFGDARNPFAKLFQLPEALKERKDKKDRKRKSRSSQALSEGLEGLGNYYGVEGQNVVASDISVQGWFATLNNVNKSVLELSMRILNHYLVGPKSASFCHVIVWLYFLIAVGEATDKYPESKKMFKWFFGKLFPWESMINYLNYLLMISKSDKVLNAVCKNYFLHSQNYMEYFNQNEFLPEVLKCWGTLWFDFISLKTDYSDLEEAGVSNYNIFDMPVSGTASISLFSKDKHTANNRVKNDHNERIARIILLARFLADNYDLGLVRTIDSFKYSEEEAISSDNILDSLQGTDTRVQIEHFLLGDSRLTQNGFLQTISQDNLVLRDVLSEYDVYDKDEYWFELSKKNMPNDMAESNFTMVSNIASTNDNYDPNKGGYDTQTMDHLRSHNSYHQQQHQQAFNSPSNSMHIFGDDYDLPLLPSQGVMQLAGNFGELMDSNITYVTLDTNVWLKHCGRIFKCVRSKVCKVLVPLIVFQELRSLRKSAEATISDAATRSVIIIRELYITREVLPLRFDGTVASDINETTEFENNSNWRASVDDTILHSISQFDEMSKKLMRGQNIMLAGPPNSNKALDLTAAQEFKYNVLITDDRNIRLRAKSVGITSFQSKWLFGNLELLFAHKCID